MLGQTPAPRMSATGRSTPPNIPDARAMSPRRDSAQIVERCETTRANTEAHAAELRSSLEDLSNRAESIQSESEKLASNNRFLSCYIGELMNKAHVTSSTSSGKVSGKN
ncbi:MAG: hypothetical protein M1814_000823 [Vezdaea aestivalis]|nr:MAG: hypothetical protein M1814_000823 [Vezdaea aestivalis]